MWAFSVIRINAKISNFCMEFTFISDNLDGDVIHALAFKNFVYLVKYCALSHHLH